MRYAYTKEVYFSSDEETIIKIEEYAYEFGISHVLSNQSKIRLMIIGVEDCNHSFLNDDLKEFLEDEFQGLKLRDVQYVNIRY